MTTINCLKLPVTQVENQILISNINYYLCIEEMKSLSNSTPAFPFSAIVYPVIWDSHCPHSLGNHMRVIENKMWDWNPVLQKAKQITWHSIPHCVKNVSVSHAQLRKKSCFSTRFCGFMQFGYTSGSLISCKAFRQRFPVTGANPYYKAAVGSSGKIRQPGLPMLGSNLWPCLWELKK